MFFFYILISFYFLRSNGPPLFYLRTYTSNQRTTNSFFPLSRLTLAHLRTAVRYPASWSSANALYRMLRPTLVARPRSRFARQILQLLLPLHHHQRWYQCSADKTRLCCPFGPHSLAPCRESCGCPQRAPVSLRNGMRGMVVPKMSWQTLGLPPASKHSPAKAQVRRLFQRRLVVAHCCRLYGAPHRPVQCLKLEVSEIAS